MGICREEFRQRCNYALTPADGPWSFWNSCCRVMICCQRRAYGSRWQRGEAEKCSNQPTSFFFFPAFSSTSFSWFSTRTLGSANPLLLSSSLYPHLVLDKLQTLLDVHLGLVGILRDERRADELEDGVVGLELRKFLP